MVLQARGHTGASTTRGVSHPALAASPGSANSVLHHFCHPTLFVAQMVRNQAARKHVLKARGQSAFHSSNSHVSPLGPTTRHVTRTKIKALWEQGMTWRAIAKTVGCGRATVTRWALKFKEAKEAKEAKDSRQHRCPRRTPSRSLKADWKKQS